MTTYTLNNGLAVYYDPADGEEDTVLGVDNNNVTLELVVPAATTSLSYTVNPLEPGDVPGEGDETVDITLDDYTIRIHGLTVGDGTPIDPEVSIFEVDWTDAGGIARTSTVLIPIIDGISVSGLGIVDADYIFVIDGAPLPAITNAAEWNAFNGGLTGIAIPTGTYGPGTAIPLTSLGATVGEDDIITGTNGRDVFTSGAGDDVINGLGDNDRLFGGGDNDELFGDSGKDELFGGHGNDKLFGGSGDDKLFGGHGNDELRGGNGRDILNPGSNDFNDIIYTGAGADSIVFSGATSGFFSVLHWDLSARVIVTIDGNANTGTIKKAGAGTTTITDVQNPMLADGLGVQGTSFKDIFNITVADGGWMQVFGGMGKDSFDIGASTGKLRLDFRDHTGASGGVRVNLRTGTINNDGFGNYEKITGTGHIWEVRGTMEDDWISGSANDESFILMAGNDSVNGRGGFDRLRYDRSGVDGVTVDLEAGTATGTWSGKAFSHTISGIEHVRGSNGNDILTGADSQKNKLEGRDGNDLLEGGFGNDELLGDAGNDRLWGDQGKDLLQGGDGNDMLWGEWGQDRLFGGAGHDTLLAGNGDDQLQGGNGNDILKGGNGNDILKGGNGNDRLDGGADNDTMTGNGGDDTFIFGTGADVVTDFNTVGSGEKIDLSGVGPITGFSDLTGEHLSEAGGNVVIDDLAGNTMTLNGVTIASLSADDFIF